MQKLLAMLFFIISAAIANSVNSATLIFDDGFESGNLDKHRPQLATAPSASFTVIKSPVVSGAYAGRFDLPFVSAAADNYRSETVMKNGEGNFEFNKEYWFSFKFRYEDWVKDSSAEMAPFQIHLRPSSWDSACATGAAWSNAPFYMWAANDYMAFNTYKGVNRWKAPIQKNTWLTITVRYIPSYSSDGVIEAWFNGSKIVSVSGANQARYDKCGLPFKPPYLKIGTYKWDWNSGKPATQSTQRTLLIDDIKIAVGAEGYSTVAVQIPAQDTTQPMISNVKAEISGGRVIILWDTDEDSNSRVVYGKTTSYGASMSRPEFVKLHSVPLSDVTQGEVYHYRVKSTDKSGNTRTSNDFTFSVPPPPDETAPDISQITEAETDTTATISWATDEDSTGWVSYGNSADYSLSSMPSRLGKSHTVTLTNLTPSTVVHYQISAKDAAGNVANSEDRSVTTKAPPLEISNVAVQFGATYSVVTWTTNKPVSGGKVLSRISCSTAPFVETVEADSTPVTQHTATVTGLLPLTSYNVSVSIADEDGNVKISSAVIGSTTGEQP